MACQLLFLDDGEIWPVENHGLRVEMSPGIEAELRWFFDGVIGCLHAAFDSLSVAIEANYFEGVSEKEWSNSIARTRQGGVYGTDVLHIFRNPIHMVLFG